MLNRSIQGRRLNNQRKYPHTPHFTKSGTRADSFPGHPRRREHKLLSKIDPGKLMLALREAEKRKMVYMNSYAKGMYHFKADLARNAR